MKCYFLWSFLTLFNFSVFSQTEENRIQEKPLDLKVKQLKQKIESSKEGKRLKLLDSLSWLVNNKTKYSFDSIAKITIDYAYQLDSINMALRHTSNLMFYYANRASNAQAGVKVFEDFKTRNTNSKDYNLLGRLYTNAADSYYFSGKTNESLDIYNTAEKFSLKANDSISYALARSYKSGVYETTGDYATASKLLLETSQIFVRAKDTSNLLRTRNQLATLYTKIGFTEEAKKERDKTIAIARHRHDHLSLIPNLFNAALEQNFQGNQMARIHYLKEAYEHVMEPDYDLPNKPIIFYGLLNAYAVTDSLNKAKHFFDKIQNSFAKQTPIPNESHYRTALADYYIATKEFNKALDEGYWVLNYHKKTGNVWGKFHMDERLSKIYKALGNIEKSHTHYVDFVTVRDSINSVKRANALSYYQTLYETERQESEIQQQQAEIAQQESEIEILDEQNKIKQQWMLFGGISILAIFIFFYARYKQRLKLKVLENELLSSEIEHKQKDLKHLALDITNNKEWALTLSEQLEKIKASKGKKRSNELINLETEIKNKIWVDESTEDFHNKIETLSSSFYEKLRNNYPNLTKTEIRLCSLIRMKMDTKQIAILQNINPSSVKMSRNRLRKKLNLTPGEDLYAFLLSY
nr:hypothetical protein [uncultured Psychroserpens sp.]